MEGGMDRRHLLKALGAAAVLGPARRPGTGEKTPEQTPRPAQAFDENAREFVRLLVRSYQEAGPDLEGDEALRSALRAAAEVYLNRHSEARGVPAENRTPAADSDAFFDAYAYAASVPRIDKSILDTLFVSFKSSIDDAVLMSLQPSAPPPAAEGDPDGGEL